MATQALLERLHPGEVHATKGNLNNRVGAPMVLFGLGPEHRYAVIEIGTNRPGEIEALARMVEPDAAVLTLIAEAHIEVEAADLMRWRACELFDAHQVCGAEANMAKHLAAKASWEAANACLQTHGGFGFAADYDVERKFRETRLYQVAPVSTNMVLSYVAEHVLGLPRSY